MKLTILGASGHGKVAADIARKNGYDEIEFLDDNSDRKTSEAVNVKNDLFVAIGNSRVRKMFMERYNEKHFAILIHPSAIISEDVEISEGSIIMAGAVVNPGSKIGKGCIISSNVAIDHDCILGDYVHAALGSIIGGGVRVGDNTLIGVGAVVDHNIILDPDRVIKAGEVIC